MQGRIVRRTMLQQEAMIERTRRVCRESVANLGRLARRFAETFSVTGQEGS